MSSLATWKSPSTAASRELLPPTLCFTTGTSWASHVTSRQWLEELIKHLGFFKSLWHTKATWSNIKLKELACATLPLAAWEAEPWANSEGIFNCWEGLMNIKVERAFKGGCSAKELLHLYLVLTSPGWSSFVTAFLKGHL